MMMVFFSYSNNKFCYYKTISKLFQNNKYIYNITINNKWLYKSLNNIFYFSFYFLLSSEVFVLFLVENNFFPQLGKGHMLPELKICFLLSLYYWEYNWKNSTNNDFLEYKLIGNIGRTLLLEL